MKKKIYFISDFHFGIPDRARSLERERRFAEWLEMAGKDAETIYLMGDLFDFWFEYGTVIPKGYIRLLGKLADLADAGVKIHLFRGNHDMWAFDYLQKEIGIELHRDPEIVKLGDHTFYLAHGDGLGPGDHGYKMIKKIFACKLNQWLFRLLHPDLGIRMGLYWSRKSRRAAESVTDREAYKKGLITKRLTVHSRATLAARPEINFFIYGHLHYPWDIRLSPSCRQVTLGDWLGHYTYAVYDGSKLELLRFGGDSIETDDHFKL